MKISVITIALNSASTIADTMRSVAAQDWPDYEHLVVDGASQDTTMAVVDAHATDRVIAVSEPDRGLYDAMNKGLARATGDAIGFLNSDDFFCRPNALSLIAKAFSQGIDCVSGQTVTVKRNDVFRIRRVYGTRAYAPWMLRFGHMPSHPSFYIRRDAFDRVGRFDTSYRIAGDFELMVRLLLRQHATMAVVPQTLVAFREGGVSTANFRSKITLNREMGRALTSNGIGSNTVALWGRYPFKVFQRLTRVNDYPQHLLPMGLP